MRKRTEQEKIYAAEKFRKASRESFAVNRSNWELREGQPPLCTIHNEEAFWQTNRSRKAGGQWVCRTCTRLKGKGLRRKWRKDHLNPFEYNLKKSYALAKYHSKKIGREFTIEFACILAMWTEQNGLCRICECPMTFLPGDRQRSKTKVTMDRIDSKHGYTPENVQLLCDQCNRAKTEMDAEQLIRFARGILRLLTCPSQSS